MMLKYSNGWGHLVMSVFLTLVGLALIMYPGLPPATSGVGIGLILAVQAAWFVPNAAKQTMQEITSQLPTPVQQQQQQWSQPDVANTPTLKMPTVNSSNGGKQA